MRRAGGDLLRPDHETIPLRDGETPEPSSSPDPGADIMIDTTGTPMGEQRIADRAAVLS